MNENITNTNTNTLSNDLSSMGGINLKETLNVPDYDPTNLISFLSLSVIAYF